MVDLSNAPPRIRALKQDHRGFPVPWFVQWLDGDKSAPYGVGRPDFRIIDASKMALALRQPRCWVCGGVMGKHRVFVIGPVCAINRVISEPPSHRECAEFSAANCPFLANPRMRRNEKNIPDDCQEAAGFGLKRNPMTVCLWESRYRPFRTEVGNKGILFSLGDPVRVDWIHQGRPATRAEVLHSIDTGYPTLIDLARLQGQDALEELDRYRERAMKLLPAA